MHPTTGPVAKLSLLLTPPEVAARDRQSLADRVARLDAALAEVRDRSMSWADTREAGELFTELEARLNEKLPQVGRMASEAMLAQAGPGRSRLLPTRPRARPAERGGDRALRPPPEGRQEPDGLASQSTQSRLTAMLASEHKWPISDTGTPLA